MKLTRVTRLSLETGIAGVLAIVLTGSAIAQVPTTLPPPAAPPAAEQDKTDAATGTAAATTSAANPPAEPTGGIGDIVVTANRRSERLQSVPAAISAFNDQQLALSGVQSTRDLQIVTPGLSFVQSAFAPQPTIRGIGTRNSNPGDEQVVPIYLDGVYQPFLIGGIFELNNVDRIEVLKGPQGTLLGRNATGGAINIITLAPANEVSGKLTAGYGSFNERQVSGYITGGDGPIAGSISGQYLEDDGYVRDTLSGRRAAALRNLLLRAKLRIDVTPRTQVTFAASISRRDDSTSVAYPINGNTIARRTDPNVQLSFTNREVRLNIIPPLNIQQKAVSANIVQQLGFADLTSISGYSRNSLQYSADIDYSPLPLQTQDVYQYEDAFSEDLFLTSRGSGDFTWVVGGFYFDDKAGFAPRRVNGVPVFTQNYTRAYAFYAQGSYKLTPALTATVGGRYSNDRKCASGNNGVIVRLARTCTTWDSFDPSATLDYAIDGRTKIYARYAQAFKSGVYNSVTFSPVPVTPEKVRSYEVGLKSDPAPWLRANLSGYYTDYSNIQVNIRDPATSAVLLQNAAAARIYGVEGEFILRPIDSFNIHLSVSLLNAKYTSYRNAQLLTPRVGGGNLASTFDASGLRLIRVPERTVSLSADYTFPAAGGNVTLSGNAFYQGDLHWSVDGRLRNPDTVNLNAQAAWHSPNNNYEIAVFGKNLTDLQVPLTVTTSANGDFGAYQRPFTAGIRGTVRF